MIEQAKELFVVEYSISQDETRVRSVGKMLEHNLRDIATNTITDYVPVALLPTRSKAEVFAVEFRHQLEEQVLSGSKGWQHITEPLERLGNQLLDFWDSEPRSNKKL